MDFRRDGKYRMENGVEKWVFLCLGMGRKQEGWKTREKNFSPRPTNFLLPNWEEKQGEKTASKQFYCNALLLTFHSRPSPTPPMTFVPNPYHFFSSFCLYLQHTVHCSTFSSLSLSFIFFLNFFFFQRELLFLVLIIPHNGLFAN